MIQAVKNNRDQLILEDWFTNDPVNQIVSLEKEIQKHLDMKRPVIEPPTELEENITEPNEIVQNEGCLETLGLPKNGTPSKVVLEKSQNKENDISEEAPEINDEDHSQMQEAEQKEQEQDKHIGTWL